jgi:hypothetical protein
MLYADKSVCDTTSFTITERMLGYLVDEKGFLSRLPMALKECSHSSKNDA